MLIGRRCIVTRHRCYRTASTVSLRNKGDDDLVRQVFDAPVSSWRKGLSNTLQRRTGLFGNQYLRTPEGFPRFARDSLRRAEYIAEYVSAHHASMSSPSVIKAFDRLSDTLCSVLDLAEFVRNSHPDRLYIDAAEEAYSILHGFMNTLNTHTGLFSALSHISNTPERAQSLNSQENAVLDVLLSDFYRSGVHLDASSRTKFVELSTAISQLERKVFTDYAPARSEILLPVADAKGLWPSFNTGMMSKDGRSIRVPTQGWEAESALQRLDKGEARKTLMEAMYAPRPDQIENMDSLFKSRAHLAQVVGQECYGTSMLSRQMAKSPQQVEAFLLNSAKGIMAQAESELQLLAELKRRHLQLDTVPELHRWDEDYYSALSIRNGKHRASPDLTPFLSVGTVIQGLSRLFEQLYGVRFVAREPVAGEVWHPDVRRLDVVSEQDGLIGILYCDLFSRSGKDSGLAAHFTVRCGRRTDEGAVLPGEESIDNGMLQGTISGKQYQLPVIALQCDFSPAASNSFASLSFHEVNTLFHEMGHAMHSMLGTTEFQTVSGTRVAADFVELPSQIMESFAEHPSVWPLFARHHKTDQVAPPAQLEQAFKSTTHFPGLTKYRQLVRSLLDQRVHSPIAIDANFSSTHSLQDINRELRLAGTCSTDQTLPWHVQFTHLAGYGATYYSYTFDASLATKIFSTLFKHDPLSRESGEKFRSEALRHGGSKDPWRCLADVLDDPSLSLGDQAAMTKVGSWQVSG